MVGGAVLVVVVSWICVMVVAADVELVVLSSIWVMEVYMVVVGVAVMVSVPIARSLAIACINPDPKLLMVQHSAQSVSSASLQHGRAREVVGH